MRYIPTGSRGVFRPTAGWGLVLLLVAHSLGATTLDELRRDPYLTPERFARYFTNFRYQFHAEVQQPGVFLATKAGDCDDYAILAADVLKEKGYHPHLIAVRMPGLAHVVCYVEERKSYLDYNNRGYLKRTVRSDGTLPHIAQTVARSFDTCWTSASEFTYANGIKQMGATISQTEAYRIQPLVLSPPKKLDLNF